MVSPNNNIANARLLITADAAAQNLLAELVMAPLQSHRQPYPIPIPIPIPSNCYAGVPPRFTGITYLINVDYSTEGKTRKTQCQLVHKEDQ